MTYEWILRFCPCFPHCAYLKCCRSKSVILFQIWFPLGTEQKHEMWDVVEIFMISMTCGVFISSVERFYTSKSVKVCFKIIFHFLTSPQWQKCPQTNKHPSTLFRTLLTRAQKGACGFSNHEGSRVHHDGEQPSSITHSLPCLPS